MRLLYWGAELYVCLAEGQHQVSDDSLHELAREALAYDELNEDAQAILASAEKMGGAPLGWPNCVRTQR